ncbi:DUF5683 domain-containing protein [Aquirufa salirivi]|uniref:DUF5683 domain-containing protein n=1 Tax=Aquirufa salirivi TaxID=3104729 RepID=A0ABW8RWL0_9BACT
MRHVIIPVFRAFMYFTLLFFCSWVSKANVIALDSVSKVKEVKVDSLPKKKTVPYKIIPREATLKSLMIPGWGQYYNRQYWKLPLVAGAFITLGIIANYNNVRYEKYRAYYYLASPHPDDPSYVPPATLAVPYEDGLVRDLDVNQLKRLNDGYRRNRDYTYIGMVLAWAFNVVDANVSAHLKTFDVSDDITLKIKPTFEYQSHSNGLVSGVSLSFNFKK